MSYICLGNGATFHGWGYRMGGMFTAFFKAVESNSNFRVLHRGVYRLFNPCLLKQNWAKDGIFTPNPGLKNAQNFCPHIVK